VTDYKHGHRSRKKTTPTYYSWKSMRGRCNNPNHHTSYDDVEIAEEWDDFNVFLDDMGLRPIGMTLDRINGELGYNKQNCRWANPTTQSRNKPMFRGVTIARGMFRSRIGFNNTSVFLGYFNNYFDACCARKSAENKLWGEL